MWKIHVDETVRVFPSLRVFWLRSYLHFSSPRFMLRCRRSLDKISQRYWTCLFIKIINKFMFWILSSALFFLNHLFKSKLAQHAYEEDNKICWKEAKVLQIEPNTTYRKNKKSAHVSLIDHPICQHSLNISLTWTPVITVEIKYYNTVQSRLSGKISVFCVGTLQRIFLSSDEFYSDSTLVLGLINVKLF
jgi:hypothetical protein